MGKHRISPRRAARLLCLLAGLTAALMVTPVRAAVPETAKAPLSPVFLSSDQSREEAFIGGKNSGIVNLLLVGQDGSESGRPSRADTLVLCTFHKEDKKLIMTSFLRDLYVPIPGHSGNRINAAFALGGCPLLKETFAENFGILIDGCIQVDFSQFSQLIDLQGGVSIELRQDEADWINAAVKNSALTAGTQLLTGPQALAYARIRDLDSDGDFTRTIRQRNIIHSLFSSCKKAGLQDTLTFLEEAAPMFSTDLKKTRLLSLALELGPILPELEVISQRIPAEGTCRDETIRGMAVLVADPDATRQFLRKTLLPQ